MENKVTNELIETRYSFLRKRMFYFFCGGIIWIGLFIIRDLLFGKRILWIPCLVFYGVNFFRWGIHYLLTKNYSKEDYLKVINIYQWKYPIIKLMMIILSLSIGIIYIASGKYEGIVIYTTIFCSGLDEFFEYQELKRFFNMK